MSEAEEVRAALRHVAVQMQLAVGDGSAAQDETSKAQLQLFKTIESLRNARVHALQEAGILREEVIPAATEIFQGSLDNAVSDSIQGFKNALRKLLDFANFLQHKIDQLERETTILHESKINFLSESAGFLRVSADALTNYHDRL